MREHKDIVEIPNNQLTPEILPAGDADWKDIGRFALSFSAYSHFPGPELEDVSRTVEGAFEAGSDLGSFTMSELRACLFWSQRRYRWLERHPDDTEMKYIRALLEALRIKVVAWS